MTFAIALVCLSFNRVMLRTASQFLPLTRSALFVVGILVMVTALPAATTKPRYYGHETVPDARDVIAPGRCNLNVMIPLTVVASNNDATIAAFHRETIECIVAAAGQSK